MLDSLHQGRQMTRIRTRPVYLCIIAVVAVLMPSLSHALSWNIQVVESDTGQIEDLGIDLAVEANGTAHVVYFDNGDDDGYLSLIYADSDADPWNKVFIEDNTLDISKQDPKAVLAVDANRVVYVVYPVVYPDDSYQLVYKKKGNDGWGSRFIIAAAESLPYDAQVDDEGRLNVVYSFIPDSNHDDAALKLYIADHSNEEIENHGNFQSGSLTIDSQSKPHLCYYDALNELLKYAVKNGNSWSIETVDSNIGDVESCVWGSASLALDSNGVPHISYYDFTNRDLKYANRLSGTWVPQTVDDTAVISRQTSIAIDSSDTVHICYQQLIDADGILLEYAVGNAGGWQFDTVTNFNLPPGIRSAHLSIACDDDDKPHICFTAPSRQTVEYAVAEICGDAAHPYPDGDADKNCVVDFFDLGLLGRYWFDTNCVLPDYCAGADLNTSGAVDNNDLDMLTETWLECSVFDCF